MRSIRLPGRNAILAAAFGLLASVAACSDDDPVAVEEEPEVQTLTLTVGASSITIDKATGAASGPLTVALGANTVTAVWRKADGSTETLITSDEFELRIVPTDPARLSWTASGAFGGTLTALMAGQTTAQASLFHLEEGHPDFGPFPITVQVQ